MRYLLAGVLAATAIGVSGADEGPIRLGMTKDQVFNTLGAPNGSCWFTEEWSSWSFYQTDLLGGEERLGVRFDADGRVTWFAKRYYPLAAMPPWLDALRSALPSGGK